MLPKSQRSAGGGIAETAGHSEWTYEGSPKEQSSRRWRGSDPLSGRIVWQYDKQSESSFYGWL